MHDSSYQQLPQAAALHRAAEPPLVRLSYRVEKLGKFQMSGLRRVFEQWLRRPPLFPELFAPYEGPECSQQLRDNKPVCLDPARVMVGGAFFALILLAVARGVLLRFSWYRRLPSYTAAIGQVELCTHGVMALFLVSGTVRALFHETCSEHKRCRLLELVSASAAGYCGVRLLLLSVMAVVSPQPLALLQVAAYLVALLVYLHTHTFAAFVGWALLLLLRSSLDMLVNLTQDSRWAQWLRLGRFYGSVVVYGVAAQMLAPLAATVDLGALGWLEQLQLGALALLLLLDVHSAVRSRGEASVVDSEEQEEDEEGEQSSSPQ
eukprot:m.185599 g.185599  ORF g.185599 m.185599 type:complete len:320 (+) comp21580_c0_seq1:734-1693(+)